MDYIGSLLTGVPGGHERHVCGAAGAGGDHLLSHPPVYNTG